MPNFRRTARFGFPLLLLSTVLLPSLFAQTNEGTLAGTVLDQSGAAIQGAQVTAKNEATGVTFRTVSGPDGGFRFAAVGIGKYDVTASQTGFTTQTQTGVTVSIASTAT